MPALSLDFIFYYELASKIKARFLLLPGMVNVKRNSTEFKTIKTLLEENKGKAGIKRQVVLYALKPGEKLNQKVSLNALKKDAATLYQMQYGTLLESFSDKDLKLYRENKETLYYFKSSPASTWLQMPFELKGAFKKQVMPLSVVR